MTFTVRSGGSDFRATCRRMRAIAVIVLADCGAPRSGCETGIGAHNRRTQGDCFLIPAAASMNSMPFGVPKPVTLSHPLVTINEVSVPKLMTSSTAPSAKLHRAL